MTRARVGPFRADAGGSRTRSGYVLAEAIVTLLLSLLVGAAICTALIGQLRVARAVTRRVTENDALRTTMHVLPAEIVHLTDADVRATGSDSISGRWFRASGVVCATSATHAWLRLRGMRVPDPAKDSLILIGLHGEEVMRISSAAADRPACTAAHDEQVYRIPAAGVEAGRTALVFERGTYYLTQNALRYRTGGEGRQPLTEELFADSSSLIVRSDSAASGMRLSLVFKEHAGEPTARAARVFLPLLNRTAHE